MALDAAVGPEGWADPCRSFGPYVYTPSSRSYLAVKVMDRRYSWQPGPVGLLPEHDFVGHEGWVRPVVVDRTRIVWPLARAEYMSDLRDSSLFHFREDDNYSMGTWTGYCDWVPLSPHRRTRAAVESRKERLAKPCSGCQLALPATGVCPDCGA